MDGKKHIGKEEAPVSAIFIYHSVEHLLQCLVKSLHQAIGLGVVDRGLEVFYLQQLAQITHCLETKGVPWSVKMSLGITTWLNRSTSSRPMFCEMDFHRGTASGYWMA